MPVFHHTHVVRLMPRASQWALVARLRGMSAALYNAALQERRDHHRRSLHTARRHGLDKPSQMEGWRSITRFDQAKSLTQIRADDPDGYGAVPVAVMRGALARLDAAYARFLKGEGGFPRFRSAARYTTVEFNEMCGVTFRQDDAPQGKGGHVWRGKLSFQAFGQRVTIRTRGHRPLPPGAKMTGARIVARQGRMELHVGMQAEVGRPQAPDRAIAYDAGVAAIMTDSDGVAVPNRRIGKRARRRRLQVEQALARAKRGSKRRGRLVKALARLRAKEARQRHDRAHRISSAMVRASRVVVMEHLSLRGMTRSAKGTAEEPGANVRAKAGLNREILDAGIGKIQGMVRYKAARAGGTLVLVDPKCSSQVCCGCGSLDHRFEGRVHVCHACGRRMDRDENAARNLLRRHLEDADTHRAGRGPNIRPGVNGPPRARAFAKV